MLIEFTPLGRRAEPHEVAPMILFLCSDEASFVAAGTFMRRRDGGALRPRRTTPSRSATSRSRDGTTLPDAADRLRHLRRAQRGARQRHRVPDLVRRHARRPRVADRRRAGRSTRRGTSSSCPSMFANGLSSSPSNTPRALRPRAVPAITIQDNVRAQHRLVTEHLGVTRHPARDRRVDGRLPGLPVGPRHPDLVERIMPTCGAARVSPHCCVFLEGAKAALHGRLPPTPAATTTRRPSAGCARSAASGPAGGSRRSSTARASTSRWASTTSTRSSSTSGRRSSSSSTPTTCSASSTPGRRADLAATEGYDGDLARALGRHPRQGGARARREGPVLPARGHGLGGRADARRRARGRSRASGATSPSRHRPRLQRGGAAHRPPTAGYGRRWAHASRSSTSGLTIAAGRRPPRTAATFSAACRARSRIDSCE